MNKVLKHAIIHKILSISAAHITKADRRKLDGPFEGSRLGALIIYKYNKHCWWVNIWRDDPTFKACIDGCRRKYSEDFLNLLRIAHAKKCNAIQVDYAGPLYKELPTHPRE